MHGNNWDIFCNVVDNFGDIGVCWRLARQLAAEHKLNVRLWVDDLASFRKLCPAIEPDREIQMQQGVTVRHWATPFAFDNDVADVVVEAFACELPEVYLSAMAARPAPTAWINLEYLSAETWINDCHGLASPHPRLPLRKHFFFPGFSRQSGGLLREANLMEQHRSWQTDDAASRAGFGLPPEATDEILVSLFCYGNPALPELLNVWANGGENQSKSLRCLVPEGLALQQAATCLGHPAPHPGEQIRRGQLTLHALPFSSQENYDHLLSLCHINFVRGEDSFVRAQWAAHPLVWQIYPQEQDAHQIKLAAFLDLYCADLSQPAATACRTFWQSWNSSSAHAAATAWPSFWQALPELSKHAAAWNQSLLQQPDLAGKLVRFCQSLI